MRRRSFVKAALNTLGGALLPSVLVKGTDPIAALQPGRHESDPIPDHAVEGGSRSDELHHLDIAPFARRCCLGNHKQVRQIAFDYAVDGANRGIWKEADERYIYGLQWAEARDVKEVVVRFTPGGAPMKATVEYWSLNWPDLPPVKPWIDDPEPDAWQGEWLQAKVRETFIGLESYFCFQPLAASENARATHLAGLDYRRTLKIRLIFSSEPAIDSVQVFSGSTLRPVQLRMELSAGETKHHEWKGSLEVYNGILKSVALWNGSADDTLDNEHFQVITRGAKKGLTVDLLAVAHSLPGSEDVTLLTLNAGERSFSFAVSDLDKGPIYAPDFHTYISWAAEKATFHPSIVLSGGKIRERIVKEAEQSYERAVNEIPPLDPTQREANAGTPESEHYLYLPLAADASWQKFAFEWSGNIHISKGGTKAKGAELRRLEWSGDEIRWRIGTGSEPTFRPNWSDSTLHCLQDVLPVAVASWSDTSIRYTEEGFATLLSGPLAPDDPERREQTPAVLLLKLALENKRPQPVRSHIWIATVANEKVSFIDGFLTVEDGRLVRAYVRVPDGARVSVGPMVDGATRGEAVHIEVPLSANQQRNVYISLPFIPRLSAVERARLVELEYEKERARVVAYWQEIASKALPFSVPEDKFMKLARATVPHLHISITKDPKSGLYVVPAASYFYGVFAQVGATQCTTLDLLGHSDLAAKGLETFIDLQGNRPMIGTYSGDQKAVYNGARIDAEHDYTGGEYNLNHGAALQALATHYLLTRDKEWFSRVSPGMMRAADWVLEQRKLTKVLDSGETIPEYGLLPAGDLEDNADWGHWFGINAEASRGIEMLASALREVGASEAAHYAEQGREYKQDIRAAVIRAARLTAVVRLQNNTYVPYIPSRPYQRVRHFGPIRSAYYSRYPSPVPTLYKSSSTREVFSGPILLLLRDVFGADEQIADWILDDWEDNATVSAPLGLNVHGWVDEKFWFSQGGFNFEAQRNPVVVYIKRNEIPAAVRSQYNSFVATYYPNANLFTEELHQWVHGYGPLYKTGDEARFVSHLRSMLIREEGDTLWLAPGTPGKWLENGARIEVKDAPTYFGPVSYVIEGGHHSVRARVVLPRRGSLATSWLVLRLPDGAHFKDVEIDGNQWHQYDDKAQRIRLPVKGGPIDALVRY